MNHIGITQRANCIMAKPSGLLRMGFWDSLRSSKQRTFRVLETGGFSELGVYGKHVISDEDR